MTERTEAKPDAARIRERIRRFEGKRFLVVGDVMLDRYLYGDVSRISPEAPVPVVRVVRQEERLGGAANVANNLIALGAEATICGVVGDDEDGEVLRWAFGENGLDSSALVAAAGRPTTRKTRIIGNAQQVVRIDTETDEPVEDAAGEALAAAIRERIGEVDGVILSDYGKGVVTETIIRWLHAQLEQVHAPEGIFLLDDIAGMMSLEHYEEFAHPRLRRIFDEFDGLLKIFHNDMPCGHLFERMADANFDVFNFTHLVDIAEAKAKMGHRVAMMGNVPPLSVGVRETPEVVAQYAKACLDKAGPGGGMILSVGGGVSPDMPAANIDAMLAAARDWIPTTPEEHQALLAAAKSGPEKAGQRRRRRRQ